MPYQRQRESFPCASQVRVICRAHTTEIEQAVLAYDDPSFTTTLATAWRPCCCA